MDSYATGAIVSKSSRSFFKPSPGSTSVFGVKKKFFALMLRSFFGPAST